MCRLTVVNKEVVEDHQRLQSNNEKENLDHKTNYSTKETRIETPVRIRASFI